MGNKQLDIAEIILALEVKSVKKGELTDTLKSSKITSVFSVILNFCWRKELDRISICQNITGSQEAETCNTDTTPTQPHRNSNTYRAKDNTTNVVIQQNSRKLLMMDILMSKICWAHKKWNKIASDIKLVFYSSTTGSLQDILIVMMIYKSAQLANYPSDKRHWLETFFKSQ